MATRGADEGEEDDTADDLLLDLIQAITSLQGASAALFAALFAALSPGERERVRAALGDAEDDGGSVLPPEVVTLIEPPSEGAPRDCSPRWSDHHGRGTASTSTPHFPAC
jgi:hypothetical protein